MIWTPSRSPIARPPDGLLCSGRRCWRRRCSAGAGTPYARQGIGNIYYVEATYQGPGRWESSDFNLTLTPAGVVGGGFPALGYSSTPQMIAGNTYLEGGELAPLPEGFLGLVLQGNGAAGSGTPGSLFLRLGGALLAQSGRRNLTVSFGGVDYALNPAPGTEDAWVSAITGTVPEANFWTDGTPVTIRIFVTGTQRGINYRGFDAIGEKTKPPHGFYQLSDFQFVVTPG